TSQCLGECAKRSATPCFRPCAGSDARTIAPLAFLPALPSRSFMTARRLEIRGNLESAYADVFTPEAVAALEALAGLDADRKALMAARIERRAARARNQQRIAFLDPQATIARTEIEVQDARAGAFTGTAIPRDLQRQWIQG